MGSPEQFIFAKGLNQTLKVLWSPTLAGLDQAKDGAALASFWFKSLLQYVQCAAGEVSYTQMHKVGLKYQL